ncbi:MAG: restriction endonuclease subunit S [Cyclobacteriaceae bacterium]
MRTVRIKDIGQIVSGSTPKSGQKEYWNGNIPWVTPKEISALQSPYLDTTERRITEAGYRSSSTILLPKNSILFTSRAPIGLVAINSMEVCTNQGFKSIILKDNAYPLYVYYVLKSNVRQLNSLGTGTTFKELSKTTFENFEIPLPSLHDQIKIATVLEKIEKLITHRKQSLKLLDELVISTFLEMFGDPMVNPNGYDIKPLSFFGTWKSGGTPSRSIKDYFNGHIPWVSSGELNELFISDTKEKITQKAIEKSNTKLIEEGSLLLGMYDTAALKSSISVGKMTCNQAISYSRLDDDLCNTLFIYYFVHIGKEYLKRKQRGARQKNLNLNMIKDLEVFNPPIEKQNQFANHVKIAESLKERMNLSLIELEYLFGSINQRALNRELNLSNLNIEHIISKSKGGSDSYENLHAVPISKNIRTINLPIDKKKPTKGAEKETNEWNKISINQLSDWIKTEFDSYHFTSEMLIKYLRDEIKVIIQKGQPLYYSSEEIKKKPKLDAEKDLKKIIYDALSGESPFLSLEQIYYDGEKENIKLNIRENDYDLVYHKSKKDRSGIYLKVKS